MDPLIIATDIVKTLSANGFIAYFAGGWVRDFLLGHPSYDIDIATDATPQQVMNLFPHTIPVGLAFGILIVVKGGHHFEVATFRRDIDYSSGRKPARIERSTPEEDAQRRDFTINGMFYDPLEKKIFDFVGGRVDLTHGILRAIGNPAERFAEDRLRMIRAIRFSSRFDFEIEPATLIAIEQAASSLFPSVAIERVWQELCKMQEAPHFARALITMHQVGLLSVIFPALKGVALEEIAKRVEPFPKYPPESPPILFIVALFEKAAIKDWEGICRYLKVKNDDLRLVQFWWNASQLLSRNNEEIELFDWTHFYAHQHSELCLNLFNINLQPQESLHFLPSHHHRRHLLAEDIRRIMEKKPLVTAFILEKEGVEAGKKMGLLLKEAEKIAINNRLHYAEDVLRALRKTSLWSSS